MSNRLEERRLRVFKAWAAGRRQLDIAQEEGVHQGQISRDIAHVCATLAPPDWSDVEKTRLDLLGKLAYAESELLAAWERSKQPRRRDKQKQSQKPPAKGAKEGALQADVESVTEGRDGNPRFLERLESVWTLRAKLTGALQNTITEQLALQLAALEKAAREHGHAIE